MKDLFDRLNDIILSPGLVTLASLVLRFECNVRTHLMRALCTNLSGVNLTIAWSVLHEYTLNLDFGFYLTTANYKCKYYILGVFRQH